MAGGREEEQHLEENKKISLWGWGVGSCFREDDLSPQDFEELLLLIEGR